ncbi:hypothetical protein HPB48_015685 [Haemaphysalis longicornis]|uniref:Uncharacterized protein n=1 Tax=Haemaphysalis longicornis TaxID=44386 RepID=A0A9J6G8P4_HAELO|nr:hypothetical protein HPB48_015685 [Haemaphysalis longicornis]
MRISRRRRALLAFFVGLLAGLTVFALGLKFVPPTLPVLRELGLLWSGYVVDTPGCKLPSYDAYHPTINRQARKPPYNYETYCNKTKPTVIRQNRSVFTLDEGELLRSYNVSANETSCFYEEVLRNSSSPSPDWPPMLGHRFRYRFGRPIHKQCVKISCNARGAELFSDYFFIPFPGPHARQAKLIPGQLSVLVLGVDSSSRLNSLRRLQKSRSYLIEERNAFEFLAYNKVGINSFPNLIPLLSGVSGTDFEDLFRSIYYDNAPLVFNVYKSLNYTTLFLEEMPLQSIFRARGSFGFKNAPTDHYPVPMMFMMDRLHYNDKFCMRSRLKTKEILKYTSDILIMNRDHPMFAYVFLAYITHDTTSDLGYLDGLLEEFFRGLGTAGVLDQTVVLFFSDHGMRFGSAIRTKIGRHEDKTPFCLWVFPRGFLAEHPEAAVWLEVNQRRLVTTYDFHATLLSIASLPALQTKPTNKGISLMSRVPPERTCEDAFIPYAFCACDSAEKKLNDMQ